MRWIFVIFVGTHLMACGAAKYSSALMGEDGVDYANFETYCSSYKKFAGEEGDKIRYTLDRIKFVAGFTEQDEAANVANGRMPCAGIVEMLHKESHAPYNPARGPERYIFRLGVRSELRPQLEFPAGEAYHLKPDPRDSFSLENLEAFSYLTFLTELYIPHGKVKSLKALNALTNLRVLDARNNEISELNDNINRSSITLKYLDLSYNKLSSTSDLEKRAFTYLNVKNQKI